MGTSRKGIPGLDGYGSSQYIATNVITAFETDSTHAAFQHESIGLTNSKYQGLSSITFRMYCNGKSAANSYMDDLTVNGTVTAASVPEPATLGLLALGGVAFCSVAGCVVRDLKTGGPPARSPHCSPGIWDIRIESRPAFPPTTRSTKHTRFPLCFPA